MITCKVKVTSKDRKVSEYDFSEEPESRIGPHVVISESVLIITGKCQHSPEKSHTHRFPIEDIRSVYVEFPRSRQNRFCIYRAHQ